MKTLFWFAVIVLFAVAMFALSGCQEGYERCADCDRELLTVQVIMEAETLGYVPGDSAVMRGFAVVTDQEDRLVRGICVNITVSPSIGLIEWDNPVLRDTTDDYGRVRFFFRSYAVSGHTVITACVGNVCDPWTLTVREARSGSEVDSIELTLDADTLWLLPYEEDSVLATLCLYDRFGNLIPVDSYGYHGMFPLSATGGRLRQYTFADTSDCAHCWWYPNHEFGEFCLWAGFAGFRDSACVFVGRR